MDARIVEIFSSIQGESELIGCRQIFIRFFGCNLRCAYCDSPETLAPGRGPERCRVERTPGRGNFDFVPNPVSVDALVDAAAKLNGVRHHSLSLTGGEPLLHARFLEEALPRLRAIGPAIYLETNGTLPEHLERVVEGIDIIGMDIKLPSVTGAPFEGALPAHAEFLAVARRKRVFVKVVVGADTPAVEVVEAAGMVAAADPRIPMTLQPVTPFGTVTEAPSPALLLDLQAAALQHVEVVKVIPQAHKMMGAL